MTLHCYIVISFPSIIEWMMLSSNKVLVEIDKHENWWPKEVETPIIALTGPTIIILTHRAYYNTNSQGLL